MPFGPIIEVSALAMILKVLLSPLLLIAVSSASQAASSLQTSNCSYQGQYKDIPVKIQTGFFPYVFFRLTADTLPDVSVYFDQIDEGGALYLNNKGSEGTAKLLGGENFVIKIEPTVDSNSVDMNFYSVPSNTEWFKLASFSRSIYGFLKPNWNAYEKRGQAHFVFNGCQNK
jgi:hypothetical protein